MADRAIVKINVVKTNFQGISDLVGRVVAFMTAAVAQFATPNPALAAMTTAKGVLDAAIATWGVTGNRGSHQDYVDLKAAANVCYNQLLTQAAYVQNLVDYTDPYIDQVAFILLSGFDAKNVSAPVGLLGEVQDLRQLFRSTVPIDVAFIIWKRPVGTKPGQVKFYRIFRSVTNDFNDAVAIATTTAAKLFDDTTDPATVYYYWVCAINAAGQGAQNSVPLPVSMPA